MLPIQLLNNSISLTQAYLAKFGVTMAQAKQYIISNLTNLQLVADTCSSYNLTKDMIADIYGEGITGSQVQSYFNSHGINTNLTTVNLTSEWLSGKTIYNIFTGNDTYQGTTGERLRLEHIEKKVFGTNGIYTTQDITTTLHNSTYLDIPKYGLPYSEHNYILSTGSAGEDHYSRQYINRDGATVIMSEYGLSEYGLNGSPYVAYQFSYLTTDLDVAISLLGTSMPENIAYPTFNYYPSILENTYFS